MGQRLFELVFAGSGDPQLIEMRFVDRAAARTCVSVRGKTSGAFRDVGTFQWTSAVRALCILILRTKIAGADGSDPFVVRMSGGLGSPAASLDYALTKQPRWMCEMFGTDSGGNAFAQRLFLRTNSNRKRPGPVIISLNQRCLATSDLSIFWGDQKIDSCEELQKLFFLIDGTTGHQEEIVNGDRIAAMDRQIDRFFVSTW